MTESLRKSGNKPNGGQPGHEGRTLERSENPDHTERYKSEECTACKMSPADVVAVGEEERRVYDIPAIRHWFRLIQLLTPFNLKISSSVTLSSIMPELTAGTSLVVLWMRTKLCIIHITFNRS